MTDNNNVVPFTPPKRKASKKRQLPHRLRGLPAEEEAKLHQMAANIDETRQQLAPSEWHRAFGERMRRTREILGISKAEAAAACLVTVRTYRRWEAGLRFYKGHWGLFSFSEKYNVTLEWLYGFSGAEPPRRLLKLVTVNGKPMSA